MLAIASTELDPDQIDQLLFEQQHGSFYLICYLLAFVILPAAYLLLCWRMRTRLTNPPLLAYFFIFGVAGGMVLMTLMSTNTLFLIAVMPLFLVGGGISLLWTLVATIRARPRTGYHVFAAWISGLMLASPFGVQFLAFVANALK